VTEQEVRGKILVALARDSLRAALSGQPMPAAPDEAWLGRKGATFVTLRKGGQLRGCVGTIEPYRSLADDVRLNARAAAFSDRRFEPVAPEELDEIDIEVAELTPTEELVVRNELEAIAAVRPGIDGVVIASGPRRGTFLPQMWDQLPDVRDFFLHLKLKAGFLPDEWPADTKVWRYQARKYKERD
jgi:hypothetical protein